MTCLSFSILGAVIGSTPSEAALSSLPVPCASALAKYVTTLNPADPNARLFTSCGAAFGQCTAADVGQPVVAVTVPSTFPAGFPTTSPSQNVYASPSPGATPAKSPWTDAIPDLTLNMKKDFEDRIIQGVVSRINNLYLGYGGTYQNSIPTKTASASPTPSKSNTNTWRLFKSKPVSGVGHCSNVGACNPYCGEGWPWGKDANNMPTSAGDPKLDPQYPMSPSGGLWFPTGVNASVSAYLPLTDGIASGNVSIYGAFLDDYIANNVQSSCLASAPTKGYDSSGFKAIGVIAGAPDSGVADPAKTDQAGWPIHRFVTDLDAATDVCSAKTDEADIGDFFDNHTVSSINYQDLTLFQTLAWDDGTILTPGNQGGCNLFYVGDYENATIIPALQTGAYVQANWQALDIVINEIENSGSLTISPGGPCATQAQSVMTHLVDTLSTLNGSGACGTTSNFNLNYLKYACSASGLIQTLAPNELAAGATPIPIPVPVQADCQNQALIALMQFSSFVQVAECEVFTRANQIFQSAFINGQLAANQIKNLAVTGCMHGSATGNYLAIDTDPSYFGDPNPSGMNIFSCINDSSSSGYQDVGIYRDLVQKRVNNCFPYAYTASFKAYLDSTGFSRKPIQNSYQSLKNNSKGQPAVQITNCQMTDNMASFF